MIHTHTQKQLPKQKTKEENDHLCGAMAKVMNKKTAAKIAA